jgi:hypothetical protein
MRSMSILARVFQPAAILSSEITYLLLSSITRRCPDSSEPFHERACARGFVLTAPVALRRVVWVRLENGRCAL